jgi:hypothetical protein
MRRASSDACAWCDDVEGSDVNDFILLAPRRHGPLSFLTSACLYNVDTAPFPPSKCLSSPRDHSRVLQVSKVMLSRLLSS